MHACPTFLLLRNYRVLTFEPQEEITLSFARALIHAGHTNSVIQARWMIQNYPKLDALDHLIFILFYGLLLSSFFTFNLQISG